eukprot:COSAG01_NODE_11810_length_1854_cov_3.327189_2_plen_341_part_01
MTGRFYASDALGGNHGDGQDYNEIVGECVGSIRRFGFCVLDHVIPPSEVAQVHNEVVEATPRIRAAQKLAAPGGMQNQVLFLPRYQRYLSHPLVVAIAREMLDTHVRIAQTHIRHVSPDGTATADGGRFGGRVGRLMRGWHTDWPHDLSTYAQGDDNAGAFPQPFLNITAALSMVWNLSPVDSESAGTWIVPGSHLDLRNPRGPADGINVMAPIRGELQIEAPAGSVFIQDTRCWHCQASHNPSGRTRVAVVTRWAPWWLSVKEFGANFGYTVNKMSKEQWERLPPSLQPLYRHLAVGVQDRLQPLNQLKSAAAAERQRAGFVDPEGHSNAHIVVATPAEG